MSYCIIYYLARRTNDNNVIFVKRYKTRITRCVRLVTRYSNSPVYYYIVIVISCDENSRWPIALALGVVRVHDSSEFRIVRKQTLFYLSFLMISIVYYYCYCYYIIYTYRIKGLYPRGWLSVGENRRVLRVIFCTSIDNIQGV